MLDETKVIRLLVGLSAWTLSGEAVRPELLAGLQAALPKCQFFVLYGASEVSSDATFFRAGSAELQRVPIGRPVPNVQVYVLNERLQPVAIGVTGELWVAGVGVGRGYVNRAELTAERFSANPFSEGGCQRLYRTGDLGRWRANGYLECLGRADQQIKVRGIRIEPGEIETQLEAHDLVSGAVVVAHEAPSGEKMLVAYIVSADPLPEDSSAVIETLRAHLRSRLPPFMVPNTFMLLERFPRTASGKIERRSLPVPDVALRQRRGLARPPEGKTEVALAEIWRDILGLAQVSREDDFFELGGHSLIGTRVTSRIRDVLGIEIPLRWIFDTPVLSALAQRIDAHSSQESTRVGSTGNVESQFRSKIDAMPDDAVLAKIAELKRALSLQG